MASTSREVSTMIKQGFISDKVISISPTRISLPLTFVSSSNSSSKAVTSPSSSIDFSPPTPPPQLSKTKHTLYQMMSQEQLVEPSRVQFFSSVSKIMGDFEDLISANTLLSGRGDVRVTLMGKDEFRKVTIDVHKRVLLEESGFFREKLKSGKNDKVFFHSVEISECDAVEVYLETLVMMYSDNLRKRLTGEDVSKVLALLKVCAAFMFEKGITACLEFLEAAPWTEEEQEKVLNQLDELQLRERASIVLERISSKLHTCNFADDIFLKLFTSILEAKDMKARNEMKNLISRMFRDESVNPGFHVSKDALYSLCHRCVTSLVLCLSEATSVNDGDRGLLMSEIAREAENLQWVVEVLIDRKFGEEFVTLWGDQKELAELHSKIPIMYRHEISKITAQLWIAIGRGQILVPREGRSALLSTWLEAFYDDFGWMRRSCRFIDKKLVEDSLGQTILTLPLPQQQVILLNWFDRFLRRGDDCPNIQRAFEIWWKRAFLGQDTTKHEESQLQVAICNYSNGGAASAK